MKLDETTCGNCGARVRVLVEYSAIERRCARPIARVGEQFDWDEAVSRVHRCRDVAREMSDEIRIVHVVPG